MLTTTAEFRFRFGLVATPADISASSAVGGDQAELFRRTVQIEGAESQFLGIGTEAIAFHRMSFGQPKTAISIVLKPADAATKSVFPDPVTSQMVLRQHPLLAAIAINGYSGVSEE